MDNNANYLMHHGTKGMKWGVRRFRNYDGTLTPAGKAQRRAEGSSGGSSGSSSGGRGGMSAKTKKRLATAAKVAAGAAAIGGAAYLANRASGGKLGEEVVGRVRAGKAAATGAYRNSELGGRAKAARAAITGAYRNSELGGRAKAARAAVTGAYRNSELGGRVKAAKAVGKAVGKNVAEGAKAGGRVVRGMSKLGAGKVAEGASNARSKTSGKFNALVEKGQQTIDARSDSKSRGNKTSLKKAASSMNLTGGEKVRKVAGRVKDNASRIKDILKEDVHDFRKNPKQYVSTSNAAVAAKNAGKAISNSRVGEAAKASGRVVRGMSKLGAGKVAEGGRSVGKKVSEASSNVGKLVSLSKTVGSENRSRKQGNTPKNAFNSDKPLNNKSKVSESTSNSSTTKKKKQKSTIKKGEKLRKWERTGSLEDFDAFMNSNERYII